MANSLDQVPPPQGCGLVQGARLPLQKRQVVDGIEDEVVPLVGAGVSGDDLRPAADDHPVHVASYQNVAVPVGHRRRVVVGAVPDQGQQAIQVPLHPLADGLSVAPEPGIHPLEATPLQVSVQRLETGEGRYQHQEVASYVAHHALDLSLVVALAGTSKPVIKQVVGLELGEGPGALALALSQYPGHRAWCCRRGCFLARRPGRRRRRRGRPD